MKNRPDKHFMISVLTPTSLEKYKEYGVIFIRLMVGFHLVYGIQVYIFDYARMEKFAEFLSQQAVPLSLFSAHLSAYAQLICGILFIFGAATRPAAIVMIINFIAAIIIAHIGDTYQNTFPALMMLSAACFLLLHGAGKLSVDDLLARRGKET